MDAVKNQVKRIWKVILKVALKMSTMNCAAGAGKIRARVTASHKFFTYVTRKGEGNSSLPFNKKMINKLSLFTLNPQQYL